MVQTDKRPPCTHGPGCECAGVSQEKYDSILREAERFASAIYGLMQVMNVNPNAALNAVVRILALVIDKDERPLSSKLLVVDIVKRTIIEKLHEFELERATEGGFKQ